MIPYSSSRRIRLAVILAGILLGGTGCEGEKPTAPQGTSQPKEAAPQTKVVLPEYYGHYAFDKGQISQLQKAGATQDFSSKAEFIVFDKRIAQGVPDQLLIYREYEFKDDDWKRYVVNYRVRPVEGKSEMIRIVPAADLAPGFYELIGGGTFSVDLDRYAATFVDSARRALEQKRWSEASKYAVAILDVIPGQQAASEILNGLPSRIVEEAEKGLENQNWDDAISQARLVLPLKRVDEAVRLRARSTILRGLFDDKGDGTIVDRKTGLMWAKEEGPVLTWNYAVRHCGNFTLAEHPDWRLPSLKEANELYERLGLLLTSSGDSRSAPFLWSEDSCYWTSEGFYRCFSRNEQKQFYRKPDGTHALRAVRPSTLTSDAVIPISFIGINWEKELCECPAICWASASGHTSLAKALLALGGNVNSSCGGDCPLIFAAYNNHIETLDLLLDSGANVNCKGSSGAAALVWAIRNRQVEAVRLLLEHKASTDFGSFQFTPGMRKWPVPHWLAREGDTEILKLLLDAGLPIELRSDVGYTLLMVAVDEEKKETMKLLISRGADVNVKDKEGNTILKHYSWRGVQDAEVVDILKRAGAK